MSFERCIPIILQSEGGYVNNPRDPGGATNFGITIHTLSQYLGKKASVEDVRALTREVATSIYRSNYYNPAHCPDLPDGVDLMVFDMAVNSGIAAAIRTLQHVVDAKADGYFGPQTLQAVRSRSAVDIINRYHDAHAAFYRALPTFPVFKDGWLARVDRTRNLAIQMAQK